MICCQAHEICDFSKAETERICVERGVELEFFLDDGDQDIGGDGAPNLGVNRVLGGWAQTALDSGCIREQLRIACGRAFAWDVPWQGFRGCVSTGRKNRRSLHYATPDFLSRSVALRVCMRLSLWRAAHVVVARSAK
jgi:hypothetical protein